MKIVNLSQSKDREAWLDLRRGVITGTKAKTIAPPKRSSATPQGIYELLAEKIAIAKDGEPERDRGLRLEQEALSITASKIEKELDLEPGMWFSDDGKLAVSPDASEPTDKPTYAAEAKCLDTKNHIQGILNDVERKKLPTYNPIDSLKIGTSDFAPQAMQYFVVNTDLETLYFTLYDDRIVLDNVMHYIITITRDDVAEFLGGQEGYERDALKKVDEMIKVLKGIK